MGIVVTSENRPRKWRNAAPLTGSGDLLQQFRPRGASTLAFQLLTIGKSGWGCQGGIDKNMSVLRSQSMNPENKVSCLTLRVGFYIPNKEIPGLKARLTAAFFRGMNAPAPSDQCPYPLRCMPLLPPIKARASSDNRHPCMARRGENHLQLAACFTAVSFALALSWPG